MSTYKAKTAKAWLHPWQVVRTFNLGGYAVLCSHRTQDRALWCRAARRVFNRPHPDAQLGVRPTPELFR